MSICHCLWLRVSRYGFIGVYSDHSLYMDMNNVSYEGNTLTYKNKDSSRTVWSAIYESYGSLLKLFRQAAEGGGRI